MSGLFLNIVNMSISASWIVLVVFLLRLLLKKAPKWITVLLWGIVAVRLICPFSFESTISLMPSAQTISKAPDSPRPYFESGVAIVDNQVNEYLQGNYFEGITRSEGHFVDITTFLAVVWVLGIGALLIYTLVSYLRMKNKIGTAVLLRDNIFQSENVVSPFVLGIIKPKIYLPFNMNEQDMEHVIAHENAHIRRKDHLWKPLGFLILTFHWFNPLMWLGYVLLCRDIELACDEKVVKELNTNQKADYSQALLTCSVNRRTIAACPLAFGEVSVKNRVKSVLNYKKPTFWIIVVSIAISLITAVCFLTNPITYSDENISSFLEKTIIEHHKGGYKSGEYCCADFVILGQEKSKDTITVYTWVLYQEFDEFDGEIKNVSGAHIPTVITAKKSTSDEKYELVEYWEPRDGVYYPTDIKEKFPWYLHIKALDSQRYIKEQEANCLKLAEEYFENTSENTALRERIEQLEQTHPHFFNLPCEEGLTLYIWEWARGIYECHLASTELEALRDEPSYIFSVGYASVDEMKAILSTYDIPKEKITVKAVINPLSSYQQVIDEEFQRKVEELFGFNSYDISKIPDLYLVCDGKTTRAVTGTCSWSYALGDGTWCGINGDSSHPLSMIEHILSQALEVSREKSPVPCVDLKFSIVPDSIAVTAWFITDDGSTKSFDAEVDSMSIRLNESSETCIYEIVATWSSQPNFNGVVRYSFAVVESDA